jgi:hypothetical protein
MWAAASITTSSSFFLPSASYLDGPVLALAIIVLGMVEYSVLHHVTLTEHIVIDNGVDVAEDIFTAVGRSDESETARIPACCAQHALWALTSAV